MYVCISIPNKYLPQIFIQGLEEDRHTEYLFTNNNKAKQNIKYQNIA
jgi:hypothetical protein